MTRERPLTMHNGLRLRCAPRGVDDHRLIARRDLLFDSGEQRCIRRVRSVCSLQGDRSIDLAQLRSPASSSHIERK